MAAEEVYSTLADLDAHGGGGRGTAPLIPLSRASPGEFGPNFPLSPFQIRRLRLLWHLCIVQLAPSCCLLQPLKPEARPTLLCNRLWTALRVSGWRSMSLRSL